MTDPDLDAAWAGVHENTPQRLVRRRWLAAEVALGPCLWVEDGATYGGQAHAGHQRGHRTRDRHRGGDTRRSRRPSPHQGREVGLHLQGDEVRVGWRPEHWHPVVVGWIG